MMNQMKAKPPSWAHQGHRKRWSGFFAEANRRCRGGDRAEVNGIVISPNEVDAMARRCKSGDDAGIPVVTIDRRVAKVQGILAACRRRQRAGGEAQDTWS